MAKKQTGGKKPKAKKSRGDGLDFNFGHNRKKRPAGRFKNGASWS
jgi:hypothetical protein